MDRSITLAFNVSEQPAATFSLSLSQEACRALEVILRERARQQATGYTAETDDRHDEEQLAALAAALILPKQVGSTEVAFASDLGLCISLIDDLVMARGPRRVVYRQIDDSLDTAAAQIDARIEDLTRGLAVGLAELERLLRLKDASARA